MNPGLIIRDFTAFLRAPQHESDRFFSAQETIYFLFCLLILDFLLLIPAAIPVSILSELDLVGEHRVEEMLNAPLLLLFLGVVLAPIMEEIIFRLYLRFDLRTLFISLLGLCLFFGSMYSMTGMFIVFLLILSFTLGLFFFALLNPRFDVIMRHFWDSHFPWIYFGSAILFGMAHLSNFYMPSGQLWLLSPFLVLPQAVLGLILGYIRIKRGIWAAILFHALHNGFLIVPTLILLKYGWV